MKTLLKMMVVLLPICVFSQSPPITAEATQIAIEVIHNKKAIDSVKTLKAKEIKKQLRLIAMIKEKIEQLQKEKKIRAENDFELLTVQDTLKALKQNTDAIYWEEVPRKWTGRLFNKDDTKIRLFRIDETGKMVYLN